MESATDSARARRGELPARFVWSATPLRAVSVIEMLTESSRLTQRGTR